MAIGTLADVIPVSDHSSPEKGMATMERTRRTWMAQFMRVLSVMIALGLAVVLQPIPAQAAPTVTVKASSTQGMAGPTLNSYQHRTFQRGKSLKLRCYERGQLVSGYYSPWVGKSDLWYQTIGDGGVWVADIDLDTGSNDPVVPRCDANLPWTEGQAYPVTQSPGSGYSHGDSYNRHAVDVGLPNGTTLRAPITGKVYFEGWSGPGGIVTLIKKPGTSNTCYQLAHQSASYINDGQKVIRGQVIGKSGGSGNGQQGYYAPHLHMNVVYCSTQKSLTILKTQERGTSYPLGASLSSWNAR
ncbi:peptidoglycan DD-metalloendopeptidase family protein [Serinicoccus hydrothermalis]|uniref:peptidoglycan DD-metalloendopeptidase family protein n=1 Tax=Serinicoccus hydrothermalis TaxID=1758689 RepID=UPI000830CE12|nr:peptidoglycan DD-metalloendopeptidase family protein [Serinicoccus hydrothermalis]